jgi:hypothetical protein
LRAEYEGVMERDNGEDGESEVQAVVPVIEESPFKALEGLEGEGRGSARLVAKAC